MVKVRYFGVKNTKALKENYDTVLNFFPITVKITYWPTGSTSPRVSLCNAKSATVTL